MFNSYLQRCWWATGWKWEFMDIHAKKVYIPVKNCFYNQVKAFIYWSFIWGNNWSRRWKCKQHVNWYKFCISFFFFSTKCRNQVTSFSTSSSKNNMPDLSLHTLAKNVFIVSKIKHLDVACVKMLLWQISKYFHSSSHVPLEGCLRNQTVKVKLHGRISSQLAR